MGIQMTTLPRIVQSTGRILSRAGGLSRLSSNCRSYSQNVVKEHDIVLLKHRNNPSAPIVTGKLRSGRKTTLSATSNWRDAIENDHIIGKELREVVTSRKGVHYRILEPTLAEYTDCSPRIVTPIYSHAASPPAPIPKIIDISEEDSAQLEDKLKAEKVWRDARRAVVHTLDINATHSKHAVQLVKNF